MRAKLAILVWLTACGGNGPGGGFGSPDARRPEKTGYVAIQSYDAMNFPGTPTRGGNASAAFYSNQIYCTKTQTSGPCDVLQCNFTMTAPPQVSAGTITVTGALQPVTLAPGADGTYPGFMVTQPVFNGGENITFAAAGAEVPAFDVSFAMPAKATITSPAEPPSGAPYLTFNRAQDFTVTWTGGGTEQLQITIDGPNTSPRLLCRFEASAGRGTIPASTLALIPAGEGSFSMSAISMAEELAGAWAVEATGYYNAVWPDNSIVSGPTMAQ